jgi:hypothetical protein
MPPPIIASPELLHANSCASTLVWPKFLAAAWEAMSSTATVCFDRMLATATKKQQCAMMFRRMEELALRVASSHTCRTAVSDILCSSRHEFKTASHSGFVYTGRGRFTDAGNWTYSVVLALLWMQGLNTELQPLLLGLASKYSSLHPTAACTTTTKGMRGDVVECILCMCRETGPSIPQLERADRLAVHAYVKELCEKVEKLRKIISGYEQIPDSEWPDPDSFLCTVRRTLGL